jgi:hypothetical protein
MMESALPLDLTEEDGEAQQQPGKVQGLQRGAPGENPWQRE